MRTINILVTVCLLVGCDSGSDPGAQSPAASQESALEITSPAGFRYTVISEASSDASASPALGDTVRIHWTGWLADGTEFGDTRRAAKPQEEKLSHMTLMPGLVEALLTMKPGERRKLYLPSKLAYGEAGFPGDGENLYLVPPNSDLTIDVELVNTQP